MDIEKLIEQANRFGMELRRDGGEFEYSIGEKFLNYATALSTLQDENAQLRAELEYEREHANAYYEECGQWEAENEKLRAELERMKKIMRDNGIMTIPPKYPGGPTEWNIPKPRSQKED